jgi:hypothetical protein
VFKEYGQPIRTADGTSILRISGIVSYCLIGNHGTIQTQIEPSEDIWRTAILFEAAGKLKLSSAKWYFCFQPHADGGYEYAPKGDFCLQLDENSSLLIRDMVRQYVLLKRSC